MVAEQAGLTYAAAKFLSVNLFVRREQRDSDVARFQYTDTLASVGVTAKF